jgi:hypothetical protein
MRAQKVFTETLNLGDGKHRVFERVALVRLGARVPVLHIA